MKEFISSKYPLLIRENHLDTFEHVNNATYLQIFEEARWDFLHSRGFGFNRIKELGEGPVVLECRLKFLIEIRLRESIVVESHITSYKEKVGIMKQEIFNGQHQSCCQAEFVFGLFDFKKRKLIDPTEEWISALQLSFDNQ